MNPRDAEPLASSKLRLVGDRRTAYRKLTEAMLDTPAACDITTIAGMGWDDMTPTQQKKVCTKCPVKDLCGDYAETDPANTHGVWGGRTYPRRPEATPEERAKWRAEKATQRQAKQKGTK